MDGLEPERAELLHILALSQMVQERIQAVLDGSMKHLSPTDREIVSVGIEISANYGTLSRGDAARWVNAHRAGDEAWLLMHTCEGVAEATYYGRLTREQRAILGSR